MWEHKVVKVEKVNEKGLQDELDKASQDGWELIKVKDDPYNSPSFFLFFKRPAQTQKPST